MENPFKYAVIGLCLTAINGGWCLPARADNGNLQIPRFVSTRSGDANLRTGPDKRYPIEWRYQRVGIPLEILEEYGDWRKVKDWDGTSGWLRKNLLTNRRAFRTLATVEIKRKPDASSYTVAKVESGAVGKLMQCPKDALPFCRIEIQGYQGWINRNAFWGVYTDEFFE